MGQLDNIVERLAAALNKEASSTDDLLFLANVIGLDRSALEKDIRALLRERIVFWLLGSDTPSQNFSQRKRFVERRLREKLESNGAAKTALDSLIAAVAVAQGKVDSARASRKLGIASLEESSLRELFLQQNYRCAVCGTPFLTSFRKSCDRFEDGFEPIGDPQLDHITPYYIFGNEGGHELLCQGCNALKNDRLGVQEDGFVLSGNHIRRRDVESIRRRTAFWSLYGARRCQDPGCSATALNSVLFVETREGRIFSHGNLLVKCAAHAGREAYYLHSLEESILGE